MTVIPFQISETEYSVFIALGDDSMERVRGYDPAQFDVQKLPEHWQKMKLRTVHIGYATDADFERVLAMTSKDGNPYEALKFLSRGFVFRPEAGDHDGPYMSVKPDSKESKH